MRRLAFQRVTVRPVVPAGFAAAPGVPASDAATVHPPRRVAPSAPDYSSTFRQALAEIPAPADCYSAAPVLPGFRCEHADAGGRRGDRAACPGSNGSISVRRPIRRQGLAPPRSQAFCPRLTTQWPFPRSRRASPHRRYRTVCCRDCSASGCLRRRLTSSGRDRYRRWRGGRCSGNCPTSGWKREHCAFPAFFAMPVPPAPGQRATTTTGATRRLAPVRPPRPQSVQVRPGRLL